MFIFAVVDYGFFTYIEAVSYIFISKICFCVLMAQIADHNYHYLGVSFFYNTQRFFFYQRKGHICHCFRITEFISGI